MDMLESRELVGEQGWSDAEQSSIPGPCLWASPRTVVGDQSYVTGNNATPKGQDEIREILPLR